MDGKLVKAKVYHFGPLILNDIDVKLYQVVKKLNGLKVLDIQGLNRSIRKKKIIEKKNVEVKKFLKNFNILKCDTKELHLIRNTADKKRIINEANEEAKNLKDKLLNEEKIYSKRFKKKILDRIEQSKNQTINDIKKL